MMRSPDVRELKESGHSVLAFLHLLVAVGLMSSALRADAAEAAKTGSSLVEDQQAAGVSHARLLFPERVLAGFTNGQDRVAIIVNLVPPPRALLPTDWHSAQSMQTLHAANRGRAGEVLQTLAADEHKVRFRFDNQPGFSCEVTLKALDKLLRHPGVESVEPVLEMQAHLAQGIPLMNASATRATYDGTGVAIAICDTGIDYSHPRLGGGGFPNSKVIGGYDFGDDDADPIPNTNGHGTCCAGIAAGSLGTVGSYIGGVAPSAKLYACKISYGTSGSADNDAMIAAWDWCVTHRNDDPANPIMVISTSFGGGRYYGACDMSVVAMTTAANNAVAAGITVLASSGNDGYCDSMGWPACISSVISVGAVYDASFGTYYPCVSSASCATKTASTGCSTGFHATDSTQADRVTSYANVASFLGVFAPANKCYTTDISGSTGYSTGDYFDSFGGTSAACPYAAGAVACLQHAARTLAGAYLSPAQVLSRLTAAGDLITDTKVAITKPRVNLGRAIDGLSSIHHFVWGTISTPQTNYAPFSVTITAKDLGGNTVTGFVSAVSLSASAGTSTNSIGSGTGNWAQPMRTTYHDSRTQVIYLTNELGGPRILRGLALNVQTVPGQPMTNWTIRMKHTLLDSYAGPASWEGSGWTMVYQTNQSVASAGWVTFPFTTSFAYNGSNNLMIDFSYNNLSASSDGKCLYTSTSQIRSIYAFTSSGYGDPLTWSGTSKPTPSTYARIPNLLLIGSSGLTISPTLSGNFALGVWTGSITVQPSGSNVVLRADDGNGHVGESSPFDVSCAVPLVMTCSSNKAVNCGTDWSFDTPSAFDGCLGTNVPVLIQSTVTNGMCPQVAARIWIAYNVSGNASATCTQAVTVVDTVPPLLTCASNKTVECGSVWSFDPPQVSDCCGTNITVSLIGSNSTVLSPCQTLWEGLWQATDCCSNSTVCTQLVMVVDTAPPLLTCASNKTVECGSYWSFDPPQVSDCCGSNVTVSLIGSNSTVLSPCQTLWEGLWQAMDCCSNSAVCTQLVLVVDTATPLLTCASNKTVECGSVWSFDLPEALDTCGGTNVTVSILSTVTNGSCPPLITQTWSAVDACGNSSSCSQVVTVVGIAPPVLTCASNKTVECGSYWSFDPPQVSDCCGTNVTVSLIGSNSTVLSHCQTLWEGLWQATDCCSNSTVCTQLVMVVDTVPPLLTCASNKTVECGSYWSFDPPQVSDCCGSNVTVSLIGSNSTVLSPCQTLWEGLWQAMDCCSNSAVCTQLVLVVDTATPLLTCASNKTVECGSVWSFDPPEAWDACGGTNVAVSILSTVTNGFCPPLITRTWSAVDACGNSNSCSQVVTVAGVAPPALTCASNKTVECGSLWSFDPPQVSDCCGSNVTVSLIGSNSTVLSPCQTLWEGLWQAIDCCSNSAVCTQLVLVVDTATPLLTCASNKTVECGSVWSFDPPQFADCCGTNVSVSLIGSNSTVLSAGQTLWEGLWQATDCCSNSTVCTQQVWVVDTTPPTILWHTNVLLLTGTNCQAAMSDITGTNYILAVDSCGSVAVTQSVMSNTLLGLGLHEVVLGVFDAAGNLATGTNYALVVDLAAPAVTAPPDLMLGTDTGTCQAANVTLGVLAVTNDNCGILLVTNDAPAAFPVGTNVVTWTAVDTGGNVATCQQTVTVVDSEAPTITCPADIVTTNDLGLCSAMVSLGVPAVTNDNCGVGVVTNDAPAVFPVGTNVVTWTVVDTSGNVATCQQTVTVVAPPYILAQPVSQVARAGQAATFTVTATNECGSGRAYQWRWNGGEITGATDSAYSPTNVQCADAGSFDVVVTNAVGSVTSAPAILTVVGELVITEIQWESANLLRLCGTGGCAGGTYCVLAATNVVDAMTNWVSLATNEFEIDGSFCLTNAVDTNQPPQFFRLRAP